MAIVQRLWFLLPLLTGCRAGHGSNLDQYAGKLSKAAGAGNVTRVQELLAAGEDVNEVGRYGYTPLMRAGHAGHADVVKVLLAAGANVNVTNNGGSGVVHESVDFYNVVKLLIDAKADINIESQTGWTALVSACYIGALNTTKLLLDNGASPTAKGSKGWTPMTAAANANRQDIIILLVAYGAPADAKCPKDVWEWQCNAQMSLISGVTGVTAPQVSILTDMTSIGTVATLDFGTAANVRSIIGNQREATLGMREGFATWAGVPVGNVSANWSSQASGNRRLAPSSFFLKVSYRVTVASSGADAVKSKVQGVSGGGDAAALSKALDRSLRAALATKRPPAANSTTSAAPATSDSIAPRLGVPLGIILVASLRCFF